MSPQGQGDLRAAEPLPGPPRGARIVGLWSPNPPPSSGVGPKFAPVPQRPRSHQLEEESRQAFAAALPSRWVVRPVNPDYGLDCSVEIFDADEKATARSFSVQLKGTDEPDLSRALGSIRFSRETADYYRAQRLPVLIVRYHAPTGRLFARWFHAYNPHIARKGLKADAKSVRFQLYEQDEVGADFAERVEAGLEGFLKFRSPELPLPLRVAVTPTAPGATPDAHRAAFSLRRVLGGESDVVTVEVRDPAPDDPSITLEPDRVVVSLADVASVTLDREGIGDEGADEYAADLTLGLTVALTYVGQANLAAQLAAAVGSSSTVIADPEVAFTIAGAMFRSQRIREAIQLADALDASANEDVRFSSFALLTVLLAARKARLQPDERELALAAAERRLERREQRGDSDAVAAEAYSLGMLHKRLNEADAAIPRFRTAAENDETYLARDYYHADFAGVLFESGDYSAAAHHYERAIELGKDGIYYALHADALLFLGRYTEARDRLDQYLGETPGPEGAEWRLKAKTIRLLIETVGSEQARNPGAADRVLNAWNFEDGPDMSPEDAWVSCEEALVHDACSGEAWFRLGLLAIMRRGEPTDGGLYSVAGATLGRHLPGVWSNAALSTNPADPDTMSDIFYAAYRLNGNAFIDQITDAISGAEHLQEDRDRLVTLLDRAVVAVDSRQADEGFVIRMKGEDGEMRELLFGSDEQAELATPPQPTQARWQPPPMNVPGKRKGERRRNRKTHGKNKKRKRRR